VALLPGTIEKQLFLMKNTKVLKKAWIYFLQKKINFQKND